jgi:hypothetical protein
VRPVPPLGDEALLERELPPGERLGIVERLDALRAVGAHHPELEGALFGLTRFVSKELTTTLEPPEHADLHPFEGSIQGVSVRTAKSLSPLEYPHK